MAERPLEPRTRLVVKHTTRTVRAIVDELVSVVDIHTLEDRPSPERLELNDIARVRLRLAEPLAVDPYAENRATGAFILIDEATNDTVGAGMVHQRSRQPQREDAGGADCLTIRSRPARRWARRKAAGDGARTRCEWAARHRRPGTR